MRFAALVLFPLLLPPAPARAQAIPFSQHAALMQRVAFTDVTVTYNRPVARGRTLFPDVVAWGRTWNPGADSATRISFSRDVTVEGEPVAAGAYSIWVIPRAEGSWTVILSEAAHVFHTPYPGEAHDRHRFDVTPERGEHMETLAFYFPVVERDRAVLRLHWGTLVIPLRIEARGRP